MVVAALMLALGLGAGYSLGARSTSSPVPGGEAAPSATAFAPGPSPAPVTVRLPTYVDLAGGSRGILAARLATDGPCLDAIDEANTRWLPILPAAAGYRVEGGFLSAGPFSSPSRIGDLVFLGGSEYHEPDLDFLQRYLVEPIDPACRGGNYWLVTSVWPAPQQSAVVSCDPTPQQWSIDLGGSAVPLTVHLTCDAAVAVAEAAAAAQLAGAEVTSIEFHFGRPCPPGARCSFASPDIGFVVFRRPHEPDLIVSVSADVAGTVTALLVQVAPSASP